MQYMSGSTHHMRGRSARDLIVEREVLRLERRRFEAPSVVIDARGGSAR